MFFKLYRKVRYSLQSIFKVQVKFINFQESQQFIKTKRVLTLMTANTSTLTTLNPPPTIREIGGDLNITPGNQPMMKKTSQNAGRETGFSQNYAIQFQLKNISRQVEMITSKGKSIQQRPQLNSSLSLFKSYPSFNQPQIDLSRILNLKANALQLGKYNYYGHSYRFESQKKQNISEKPVQFNQSNLNQELKSFSPTTKYIPKRQELDVPDTQSYYIYFDEPKNQNNTMENFDKQETRKQFVNNSYQSQKGNTQYPEEKNIKKYSTQQRFGRYGEDNDEARTPPVHVFSKQQPESKWVLQKKVKKLEKELNEIKRKEQKRQKLKNFSYNQPKKDEKVFVGRQVDQLINSLWP